MGFADAYLQKAGLREALIEPEPHSELKISVTIPVMNESGLERCLDSLFQCSVGTDARAEVLILINAPAHAPEEVLEQNRATLEATRKWIRDHPHPSMDFHVWMDHSFGKKEAGVGTARKILMDEAVGRFSLLDRPDGIIACLDADAVVQPNYLRALVEHFQGGSHGGLHGRSHGGSHGRSPDGCSIRFAHPLSGDEYAPEVYEAIAQYELHLRYYLQSLRSTGYPHAFHTVGSSLAVRAHIYCLEGGMNRRQAGEDFYFIQKLAQRGNYSECNSTCVVPSPRPSNRVPFGTGLAVSRMVDGRGAGGGVGGRGAGSGGAGGRGAGADELLLTYPPEPFRMLRKLFDRVDDFRVSRDMGMEFPSLSASFPPPLREFLEAQEFVPALEEMRSHSASLPAFRKRFWRWFNMFRIMKFLHVARERGYPDIPVNEAASALLRQMDPEGTGIPSIGADSRKLLLIYRRLDLMGATLFPR